MNTFTHILSKIWQFISAIICWVLSIIILGLSKLKDLLSPNKGKKELPEYVTKQNLFDWLDEYFKKNTFERVDTKTDSPESDMPPFSNVDDESDKGLNGEPPHKSHIYELPTLDLLDDYPQSESNPEEIEKQKQHIKQTLGDFGISVTEIIATVGAKVTLYELILARGVSANKIKNIDDDIARELKVQAVRIISPFKDRGTVGLEVPNNTTPTIGMKDIFYSPYFNNSNYVLPLALGKTIDNKPQIIDLSEVLHILIGGATGQGKSVCLNAMLSSLLYKKSPEELKLILIDPKVNEFSIYRNLGNKFKVSSIEKTVFTNDLDEIAIALQSLFDEMTRRQTLFDNENCRNIKEYNSNKQVGSAKYLPRIVVVIDEFVDVLKSKSSEKLLLELVRKSRAQGIHFIVATQRPSAKQCSSEITSQFTARIAFKVTKRQDSEIILGTTGAEKLVGKGDMLLSNNSEIERLQGAFVSTEELNRVIGFIAEHGI